MTEQPINLDKVTEDAAATAGANQQPQVMYVSQQYGDAKTLDFTGTTTLREYLNLAGITVGKGQVVTVNGSVPENLDIVPEPNSAVVVTSANKNG